MANQLTPDAQKFALQVAQGTGLNLGVVQAWVAQESAFGRSPAGAFNFLNMRGPGGPFTSYSSAEEAAAAVVRQLHQAPEWYGQVLVSAGKPPAEQIAAIAASPWDAGHYGGNGGVNLVNTYNSVTGHSIQSAGGPPTLAQAAAPTQAATAPETPPAPSTDDNLRQHATTLAKYLAEKIGADTDTVANGLYSLGLSLRGQYQQADASEQTGPISPGDRFAAFDQATTNALGGWTPDNTAPPPHLAGIVGTDSSTNQETTSGDQQQQPSNG